MSDHTKKQLLNAAKTLLWWVLLSAVSFLTSLLMYCFAKKTGEGGGGFFLSVTLYSVQPVCYAVGALLFLAAAAAVWFYLLRPALIVTLEGGGGWAFLWVMSGLLGLVCIFGAALAGLILNIGVFSGIRPEILEYWVFAAPAAVLLLIVIDLLIRHLPGNQNRS